MGIVRAAAQGAVAGFAATGAMSGLLAAAYRRGKDPLLPPKLVTRRLLPGGGTVTGASVPAADDRVGPLAHPMVLHTVTLGRQEAKRLVYLSIPATRGAARDAPAPLATAGPLDAARAQGRPA